MARESGHASGRFFAGAGLGRERYRGGYCCRMIWQAIACVFPPTPLPGGARDTCWFDAQVRFLVDRFARKLAAGPPGSAAALIVIVRDVLQAGGCDVYYRQATVAGEMTRSVGGRREQ